jgi:hypothetical protein
VGSLEGVYGGFENPTALCDVEKELGGPQRSWGSNLCYCTLATEAQKWRRSPPPVSQKNINFWSRLWDRLRAKMTMLVGRNDFGFCIQQTSEMLLPVKSRLDRWRECE